jgi:hypothetical protein
MEGLRCRPMARWPEGRRRNSGGLPSTTLRCGRSPGRRLGQCWSRRGGADATPSGAESFTLDRGAEAERRGPLASGGGPVQATSGGRPVGVGRRGRAGACGAPASPAHPRRPGCGSPPRRARKQPVAARAQAAGPTAIFTAGRWPGGRRGQGPPIGGAARSSCWRQAGGTGGGGAWPSGSQGLASRHHGPGVKACCSGPWSAPGPRRRSPKSPRSPRPMRAAEDRPPGGPWVAPCLAWIPIQTVPSRGALDPSREIVGLLGRGRGRALARAGRPAPALVDLHEPRTDCANRGALPAETRGSTILLVSCDEQPIGTPAMSPLRPGGPDPGALLLQAGEPRPCARIGRLGPTIAGCGACRR